VAPLAEGAAGPDAARPPGADGGTGHHLREAPHPTDLVNRLGKGLKARLVADLVVAKAEWAAKGVKDALAATNSAIAGATVAASTGAAAAGS
jgi:hypothetical protein